MQTTTIALSIRNRCALALAGLAAASAIGLATHVHAYPQPTAGVQITTICPNEDSTIDTCYVQSVEPTTTHAVLTDVEFVRESDLYVANLNDMQVAMQPTRTVDQQPLPPLYNGDVTVTRTLVDKYGQLVQCADTCIAWTYWSTNPTMPTHDVFIPVVTQ